ncbi:PXN1 protein, partial [Polypterus senegalus]|nr:PXN1 protein [Polypterus senegalus]
INIATGGLAEQSSQYAHGGAPDLAIDGKRNTESSNRSCSHTEITYPSWWRVNLKAVYAISTVVVYNRQDCCDIRLLGAEVRVGATPDVSDHLLCGTIEAVYPGSVHTICCNEMKGQYVSVVLPNRADYLSLCEVEVYGEAITPECKPEPNAINIAKQGTADQSSYYSYLGSPSHAIDGNRNGIFGKGSCTHTQKDTPSWWRVNLKATYAVSAVVVYNREDCCDNILMGAEIRVGDLRDVSKQVKCGTITAVYPGSAHTICCNGMKGQFVSVVLPNQYLTLCEVEVYGEPVPTECAPAQNAINLARRGTAEEQSSFFGSAANHAIDGRTNGNYNYGSCTHTGLESSPWWRVNLRASYAISSVVVYNRQDCCDGRLNGAEIRIGDSPDVSEHVKCGTIEETYPGSVHTICCHGRRGQYVSVVLPNQLQYLTLCEVEVYGEARPTVTNSKCTDFNCLACFSFGIAVDVARQGIASQSTTYLGTPSLAIDGNTDGNFADGSCTHTNFLPNSWWEVDLRATYAVSMVVVYNRADCCHTRLMGAQIQVGQASDVTQQITCGTITTTNLGSVSSICCNGLRGRYVSVVLPNTPQSLTLCEVKVYGVAVVSGCTSGLNGNVAFALSPLYTACL